MDSTSSSYQPPVTAHRKMRGSVADRLATIIQTQNEVIAASDDFDAVLQLICDRTQTLADADGVLIELLEGDSLVTRACGGLGGPLRGMTLPLEGSLSGHCIRTAEVLHSHDTELDERVHQELCRRFGIRSMLVVPLLKRTGPIGVLKVFSVTPRAFCDAVATNLQLMSGVITAAISLAAERAASDALVHHDQAAARALALASEEQEITAATLAIAAAEKEAAAVALAQKTAVISTFFQSSPWLMGVVELVGEDDFRFLEVNDATCRVYQRGPSQIRRKLSSELGDSVELRRAARAAYDQAAKTRQPAKWQVSHLTPEGMRHFSGTVAAVPERNGDTQRFCYLIEDITEQLALRSRLEVQQRMAAVGQLAAGVAHEVNNPLAYLIANLNFATSQLASIKPEGSPPLWDDLTEALVEACEGAERVRVVVKDLYSVVRAEKDKELRDVADLAVVADRAAQLTGNVVLPRAKLIRDFGGPAMIRGNASRLGQVVINLLANAAQAMPAHRAVDQNEIVLRVGSDGKHSFIEVRDNGSGMDPSVKKRLFEPFFTTKPVGQGMGLGLSICHTIATEHGGALEVETAPGAGTTFRLLLPALS